MSLRNISFLIFILFAINGVAFSQNLALSKIDKKDLKRHLTFISSDSLQGRKFGTDVDGLGITAEYLKTNIEKTGLKPGADNYFQEVKIVSTEPGENSFAEIETAGGKSIFKSASIINLGGSSSNVSLKKEEVILAGFGYQNTETAYNDLGDIEIKGKIVIVAQGNPKIYRGGDNFRWNNRLEREKFNSLAKKNPKAIILTTNPQDKENKTFSQIARWMNRQRYTLKSSKETEEVPTLICTPELADQFLGRKGKYKKYLTAISKKSKPNPVFVEDKKLNIEIAYKIKPVDAKNVIGIVEGSDPLLKDECVIFVAHYDHLGVAENGDVYNGADDNGSGTVTLMEVAEAFTSLEQKPKRSIVFLWVTAEEIGLLGSKYYTENPIFPLEKTVACINIDMDGRVYEPRDSVWNKSPKKVKDFDGLFTLTNDIWPELKEINTNVCKSLGLIPDYSLPANFIRSSDHYYFHDNGVPVLNYATGYHADYHKVGDEISKINFEKIKRVADLCFLVGLEIANSDEIKIERIEDK
jgi:hypothetical protein